MHEFIAMAEDVTRFQKVHRRSLRLFEVCCSKVLVRPNAHTKPWFG